MRLPDHISKIISTLILSIEEFLQNPYSAKTKVRLMPPSFIVNKDPITKKWMVEFDFLTEILDSNRSLDIDSIDDFTDTELAGERGYDGDM